MTGAASGHTSSAGLATAICGRPGTRRRDIERQAAGVPNRVAVAGYIRRCADRGFQHVLDGVLVNEPDKATR